MTLRKHLPNRREHVLVNFTTADGFRYTAGLGYFADGRLAEIFLNAAKSGTAVETTARDSAVVASLALQHGVPTETIRPIALGWMPSVGRSWRDARRRRQSWQMRLRWPACRIAVQFRDRSRAPDRTHAACRREPSGCRRKPSIASTAPRGAIRGHAAPRMPEQWRLRPLPAVCHALAAPRA